MVLGELSTQVPLLGGSGLSVMYRQGLKENEVKEAYQNFLRQRGPASFHVEIGRRPILPCELTLQQSEGSSMAEIDHCK